MKTLLLSLFLALGVIGLSYAGPVRPIRSSTFQLQTPSGPLWDTFGLQGQWFMDPVSGAVQPKTWEFHDDDNPLTVKGIVQSITFDGTPMSNIVAFTVLATVVNNLPSPYQSTGSSNSHFEVQSPTNGLYSGAMRRTRIAAEFAVADMTLLPSGQTPYYTDPVSGGAYFIEAVNEHEWAWYCWTPGNPQLPPGNFQVPTWILGDIPPGGSASILMQFKISNMLGPAVMPMTDYRSAVIRYSLSNQGDIYYARHPSLKISHWLDTLLVDYGPMGIGLPFEEPEYVYASDVSVFFDQEMDFGDAPDGPYPTLLVSNGARHIMAPGVFMGNLIDADPDGQPNATATGDDSNNLADEDGVVFTSPLIPGFMASVNVTCSVAGFLSAWVDFNLDGSWGGAGEQIFTMRPMSAGVNALVFPVPAKAGLGATFARFRFTTLQVPMTYTGLVDDGEVEDYQVLLEEEEKIDFGDAWDSPTAPGYPTLLINNGARHTIVPGVLLGGFIDAEPDGLPDPNALGDDNSKIPDDEDGVFIPSPLIAGASVNVQVIASTNGFLNAWIDWNSNGSWADPGEQVYWNVPLSAGPNTLALNVPLPPAIVSGGPHSRWRFTTYAPVTPSYTGQEKDGEVEDYEVRLQVLDFGDAPAVYPTLLVSNGARHLIPSSYYLGALAPDLEQDGQPNPSASGDDSIGVDDEDGVTFSGLLIRGSNTTFKIVASTNGWLNAWIDFNQNGSWGDKGEQIATDVGLASGTNTLVVSVPAFAAWGQTFGRFRFSSAMGLLPTGLAYDGEVEDYDFTIYQPKPTVTLAITNITCNASNTVATIKWNGESPLVYETQYADVLSTSMTWTAWGPYVSSSPYEQTNSISGQTSRFYRVSAPYTAP